MALEVGYIVEYSEKRGLFQPFGDRVKAFATQKTLAKMLQSNASYAVWYARWVNYAEYRLNNGELPQIEL